MDAKTLLYEQLAEEMAGLIASGVLQPGDRLPSVRRLSEQRRLSISTVLQALRRLEDDGQIEARPQAGFYVKRRGPQLPEPAQTIGSPASTHVGVNHLLIEVLRANERPGVLPLGSAWPSSELLPGKRIQRIVASVMRRRPQLLDRAGCSVGNDEQFVRKIVYRSLNWGGCITPEEIVVTNSCTEALNLCLRAVASPGDTIVLESPTYFVLLQIIESLGMKALEIPTHPRTGLSVEALELATRNGQVQACLLIPNANNPLGCIMPEENKRRVAALLAERGVPLIEDDIYGELHFEGERPWPIKAYDSTGNVMLCSSFSKTASPVLRGGFVAAGRYQPKITLLKTLASGMTSLVPQAALAEFINVGGYDHHVRKLRRAFAQQVATMSDAVTEYFPDGCLLSRPQGGFVLWVELPEQVDTLALHSLAIAEGIAFMPGQLFSASGRYKNCLRLNCGNPWSKEIENGVRRLGELARRMAEHPAGAADY